MIKSTLIGDKEFQYEIEQKDMLALGLILITIISLVRTSAESLRLTIPVVVVFLFLLILQSLIEIYNTNIKENTEEPTK